MALKIRLINYDASSNWILDKFSRRMYESLMRLGLDVAIATEPDPEADINHHICYAGFDGVVRGYDTLMITHIDDSEKLALLQGQMKTAAVGICMSAETVRVLSSLGIPRNKLCFVNPAHDGVMPIRKIVVGIACRVQEDGRKRETFLSRLSEVLDARFFSFRIMGDGWSPQVDALRARGFSVDYFDRFDYAEYLKFMPSLDYYLYMGMDEGQMGFIDALAAGVDTIVTAQGYHLDARDGVVHPFMTYDDLEAVFLSLQQKKRRLIASVASWNWDDYARKHVEIWQYLVTARPPSTTFDDGLNSLLAYPDEGVTLDPMLLRTRRRSLRIAGIRRRLHAEWRRLRDGYVSGGVKGVSGLLLGRIRRRLKRPAKSSES